MSPDQRSAYMAALRKADSLYHTGCYLTLKEAFRLYEEALGFPLFRKETAEKLLKTAILLGLREKELGILGEPHLARASEIIASYPSLEKFAPFLPIARSIPRETAGILGDAPGQEGQDLIAWDDIRKHLPEWVRLLREKSGTEPFYAYLYITFQANFSYIIKEDLHREPDISSLKDLYGDIPLIRYVFCILPEKDPEGLSLILREEPRFVEAAYVLGQIAFRKQHLLTAEKYFIQAYKHIPESSSLLVSLASISFALEEYTRSLEYYEKVLSMAPYYREALLGKTMCLSYLGEHSRALETARHILSLGKYYIGEARYWMAWNANELEEWDMAHANIEAAKKYLIGHSEVLSLAGIIAFHQEKWKAAEENLSSAIRLNPMNCEALYFLGRTYSATEAWERSGHFFERASACYEKNEQALEEKIKEIQTSPLSEDRRKRLIARKRIQLKKTQLTKATARYNAAAGYYNTGLIEKALSLAEKAAMHPALKASAEDLVRKIKKQEFLRLASCFQGPGSDFSVTSASFKSVKHFLKVQNFLCFFIKKNHEFLYYEQITREKFRHKNCTFDCVYGE